MIICYMYKFVTNLNMQCIKSFTANICRKPLLSFAKPRKQTANRILSVSFSYKNIKIQPICEN